MRDIDYWHIGIRSGIFNHPFYRFSHQQAKWNLMYADQARTEEEAIALIEQGCVWLLNNKDRWDYHGKLTQDLQEIADQVLGKQLILEAVL
jgi:hypothetical protein